MPDRRFVRSIRPRCLNRSPSTGPPDGISAAIWHSLPPSKSGSPPTRSFSWRPTTRRAWYARAILARRPARSAFFRWRAGPVPLPCRWPTGAIATPFPASRSRCGRERSPSGRARSSCWKTDKVPDLYPFYSASAFLG